MGTSAPNSWGVDPISERNEQQYDDIISFYVLMRDMV